MVFKLNVDWKIMYLKKEKWFFIKFIVASVALVLCTSSILYFYPEINIFQNSFNREKWVLGGEKVFTECARGRMALDVMNTVIKKGMSKSDVITKLGKPDRVGREYVIDRVGREYVRYHLGMCSPVDPSSLEIYLNSEDLVIVFEIKNH